MEEIQENEYCRTDKGIIFKVDKEHFIKRLIDAKILER